MKQEHNLLAISGRIGSGKDTLGKIIQVLCFLETVRIPYSMAAFNHNLEKNFSGKNYYGHWHIKKFAAKLKQVAALVSGCNAENFESQEFKNKQLGAEWTQHFKTMLYKDLTEEQKQRCNTQDPLQKVSVADVHIPTYRWLLQVIGTDAMRDQVHHNIWVNALFADFVCSKDDNKDGNFGPQCGDHHLPKWIITDMRFPNEMEAVKQRGGLTIRINRPGTTHMDHISETALDDALFDYTIQNNGTIEELVENIREVLLKEKILKG